MTDKKQGVFVVSLDFELFWGGLDCWTVDGYGQSHVAKVREVVDKMLALFSKYEVHATFATVGFVMMNNADDIKTNKPRNTPTYRNAMLNPYGAVLDKAKQYNALFFASDVVERLKTVSNIEVGTHTFCHYYCWEEGQTLEQFDSDIEAACKVAKQKGIKLESIVFPRNQVSKEYLDVCARHGILTYRGNARKYFDHTTSRWEGLYNKIARLIDSYVNWGGNTSIPYSSIDCKEKPLNIPASRMLRPYMRELRLLEPLRLRRIKGEILYAAKHHEIYHLWWHPHNFGANMEENLSFLEKVLKCYLECHQKEGMISMTMNELYEFVNE